jgi:hypothetical protein
MNQKDMDFLEANGWVVECESPLEIRDQETGSFATGYAARCVLESLRAEEKRSKIFVMNENVARIMQEAINTTDYPEDQEYVIEPNKYFCARFAELLVQECAEIVVGFTSTDEVRDGEYAEFEASEVLKATFGSN